MAVAGFDSDSIIALWQIRIAGKDPVVCAFCDKAASGISAWMPNPPFRAERNFSDVAILHTRYTRLCLPARLPELFLELSNQHEGPSFNRALQQEMP